MSRRLLIRLTAVMIVLAVSGAIIGGAARAQSGVIATALVAMNIRSGPSVSFEKVGILLAGDSVQLDGRARGWARFTFPDGGKGWISLGGLEITGDFNSLPDTSRPDLVVVATPPVDGPAGDGSTVIGVVPPPANAVIGTALAPLVIRGGPGRQFEKLGTIPTGQSIVLDGRSGGWFRFSYPNSNVKGWLSGTLLKITGDFRSLPSVTFPPELTPTP